MNPYLLIMLADVLLAVNFALQKVYQKKAGIGIYTGLFFNAALGFLKAV